MKNLRLLLSLLPAMTITAVAGPGVAVAEDAEASAAATDTIEQVVAMGKATGLEERSVTVAYADLKIESEPGAEALHRRLRGAAETVCDVGDAWKTRLLWDREQAEKCYHRALDAAVESVGSELLTSIHAQKEHGEILAASAD